MNQSELVLVMPAYNEEGCIAEVITQWSTQLASMQLKSYCLIIVNDGSKDKTGEILDQIKSANSSIIVVHQQNAGHGMALRSAYEKALSLNPEWVFHVDSDDQFVPQDLQSLWAQRHRSNFMLGFRQKRFDATHRLVITRILRLLNLILFGVALRDANIPFRLVRASYLKLLLSIVPATVFAPNIFLSVLAARDGQDLISMPVSHRDRQTGVVSIVRWRLIKACLRCVAELWSFRLNLNKSLIYLRHERAKLNLNGKGSI